MTTKMMKAAVLTDFRIKRSRDCGKFHVLHMQYVNVPVLAVMRFFGLPWVAIGGLKLRVVVCVTSGSWYFRRFFSPDRLIRCTNTDRLVKCTDTIALLLVHK